MLWTTVAVLLFGGVKITANPASRSLRLIGHKSDTEGHENTANNENQWATI